MANVRKQIEITTHSFEETRALGQKLGGLLKKGIIALSGDLGSGKTSFVQGLARGLDVPGDYYITSPSFTLINEYPGRCLLFHVDLYRSEDPVDFEDLGLAEILDSKGVVTIEWADRLPEGFLKEHLAIHFEIVNNTSRKICLRGYGPDPVSLLTKLEEKDGFNCPEIRRNFDC